MRPLGIPDTKLRTKFEVSISSIVFEMGCVKMQDRKMKDMKNGGQVQHNTTRRQAVHAEITM